MAIEKRLAGIRSRPFSIVRSVANGTNPDGSAAIIESTILDGWASLTQSAFTRSDGMGAWSEHRRAYCVPYACVYTILPGDLMIDQGQRFRIDAIRDPDGRKREIELICMNIVGTGISTEVC